MGRRAGPFPDRQIDLLRTFADQAVIAVENVRLFQELEARNRDLEQTATSEILRVISRSPTDVQPVFDVIAASARRLCDGTQAGVLTYDGALVALAALDQFNPEGSESLRRAFPMPPSRGAPPRERSCTGTSCRFPTCSRIPTTSTPRPRWLAAFAAWSPSP